MFKYYNDGKGKLQSHEIYDDKFTGVIETGYGRNIWEALDNYRDNVNNYLQKVGKLYEKILDNPTLHIVDGTGCLIDESKLP